MSVILIYLHLAVILSVGVLFCNIEMTSAKVFGVLNDGYAIYNLWMVFRG